MSLATPNHTFKEGKCRTVVREQRSWGDVRANLVKRTGLRREETALAAENHLILLNLQGNAERGEYFLDGRRAGFTRRMPGAVLFVPSGCTWSGWEEGASTAAYLSISISRQFVDGLGRDSSSGSDPRLSPDLGFFDPIIMQAARGIGEEIREKAPYGSLLVESYATTIVAQLFRRMNYMPRPSRGSLSPAVMNRLTETIDAELASDMSLSYLAGLAGVSVPHLCRAFKQTTGMPPHAFVHQRRLERASEHLRHTTRSMTEIALACGFSSSSHLSNAFRKAFGMTPGSYRRSWPIRADD